LRQKPSLIQEKVDILERIHGIKNTPYKGVTEKECRKFTEGVEVLQVEIDKIKRFLQKDDSHCNGSWSTEEDMELRRKISDAIKDVANRRKREYHNVRDRVKHIFFEGINVLPPKKYVVYPGYVYSQNDGDRHYLSAEQIMNLHGGQKRME